MTTIYHSLTFAKSTSMEQVFCILTYGKFVLRQSAHTLKVLEFLFEPPIHTHIYIVFYWIYKKVVMKKEKRQWDFLARFFVDIRQTW